MKRFVIIEVDVNASKSAGGHDVRMCFAIETGPGYSLEAFGGFMRANEAAFNYDWRILGEVVSADTIEELSAQWDALAPGRPYFYENLIATGNGSVFSINFEKFAHDGVLAHKADPAKEPSWWF